MEVIYVIRNNTPVTLAIFWGLIWGPFFDEVNDRRLPLQLQPDIPSTTSMMPPAEPRSQLPRTILLGTPVNKSGPASSEAHLDYTRGGRRHLRLHGVLLLLVMHTRQ